MLKLLIQFTIFLVILGCGTMFDKKGSSGSSDKVSLPKEIFMEIPKILREDRESKNSQKLKEERSQDNISEGYKELKESIEGVVWSQKLASIYLLFARQIIHEVGDICEKEELNSTCIIDEGELSFIFDDKFIRDVSKIIDEDREEIFNDFRGRVTPLGQVEFTRYDEKEDYQYNLKVDSTPVSKVLGDNTLSIQTFKWSKDQNRVLTILNNENSLKKDSLDIFYLKKESGEKEMSMDSTYNSNVAIDIGEFYLKIIDKNDENETFEIDSRYRDRVEYSGEIYDDHSISSGEISREGGFLDIEGSYFDYRLFKESYLFDGSGEIISSLYCEESLVCDMGDNSTWLDVTSLESTQEVELRGEVGGLSNNTRYFIFAPDVDIEDNALLTSENQERIFDYVVGQIYILDKMLYGELFSDQYVDRLDELVIARSVREGDNIYIEVVSQEDRPALKIYTE